MLGVGSPISASAPVSSGDLYHLDKAALASCTALVADRDSAATTIERMAALLLTAVSHPKAVACVKGRFFDGLDVKLNQLARFDSNELVSVDLQAMATALFRGQKETVRYQTCAPRPKA
jgi:hypothetical protein